MMAHYLRVLRCFLNFLLLVNAENFDWSRFSNLNSTKNPGFTHLLYDNHPVPIAQSDDGVTCAPNQFRCLDGEKCIPAHWRCDLRADCSDGSDEPMDCQLQSTCQRGQFRCKVSQRCIPDAWKCDGEPDCGYSDSSDEDVRTCNRVIKCPPNQSRCENNYAEAGEPRSGCVPTEVFCDDNGDCPDNSDEWEQCLPEKVAECGRLNCTHGCKSTRDGPTCFCPPGDEPQGTLCVDTNECLLPDSCEQTCTNSVGSYDCECVAGYRKENKIYCSAINDPESEAPSLIVTTQQDLRRVKLTGAKWEGNTSVNVLGVRAVDFDYTNRKICYIHNNMTQHSFVCLSADDFSKRQIMPAPPLFPDLSYISHISYDWISHNWYFVDEHREVIYACEKNFKFCRIIVEMDLNKVKGYVLDPTRGYQFWSVWGLTSVSISRANLDGEDRKQLVTQKLVYPEGLTVYLPTGRVYWVEAYLDYIESVDFDGNHRTTVKRGHKTLTFAHVSAFESRLYLPMSYTTGLVTMSRFHRSPSPHINLNLRDDQYVVYFDIFHRQKQPIVSHPCQINNGGCQHLCITGYRGNQTMATCVCMHGYRLRGRGECIPVDNILPFLIYSKGTPPMIKATPTTKQNRSRVWEPMVPITDVGMPTALDYDPKTNYVYYSDVQRFEIVRQKLDGSGRERFVTMNIDNCEGVAIDWLGRNLYWTDEASGQISVARLDNSAIRRVLISAKNFNPRSIVLDPVNGMMYWSDWASHSHDAGKIEMAFMDGTNRTSLVTHTPYWPNGLAINYDAKKLYWCDTYLNQIESINLDGTDRRVIIPRSVAHKPYSVAVFGTTIFWTEHRSGLVRRSMGGNIDTLATEPQQLYDMKIYDTGSKLGNNPCSLNATLCPELCLARPDGYVCASASDSVEAGPKCDGNSFDCGHGHCINRKYVCDGDADCPNKSDEDKTPGGPCEHSLCNETEFMCDTNRCIAFNWVCDGHEDCRDGSDESPERCRKQVCSSQYFTCKISGRCIPAGWKCDKQPDCGPGDNSDEECDLPDCDEASFRCDNGNCLPWQQYCDGTDDCRDGSDERSCKVSCVEKDEFLCVANGVCLPLSMRCDGKIDCLDESDEYGCASNRSNNGLDKFVGNPCEEHEFQCLSLQECIRKEFRCDHREDCIDGSDERGCDYLSDNNTTTHPVASTTEPSSEHVGKCLSDERACDKTRCVPLARFCDGMVHCFDESDEGLFCTTNTCSSLLCTHKCAQTPDGPTCYCPRNYQLLPDNVTCVEGQACSQWGVCSQSCQEVKSSHKCTCLNGYQLAADGFTCKSIEKATPILLYSDRREIRSVDLISLETRSLITSLKVIVALSFYRDGDTYQIFLNDILQERIFRGTLIGGYLVNVEPIVQSGLESVEGLAVDWIGRNLYWLDGNMHQIEVSKLDGSHRSTLIAGDIDKPRALAIDSRDGLMFWSDWSEKSPRIERCSLAGKKRTVIVKTNVGNWPNGLSIDMPVRRIYWADARSHTISTSRYDGTDLHVVLTSEKMLSHPYALTLYENYVYWTDWRKDSVVKADRFRKSSSEPVMIHKATGNPLDLIVLHPSRQPAGPPNPCETKNGGCSHLCLIDGPGTRACACPNMMSLNDDLTTCQEHDEVLTIVGSFSWSCVWVRAALPLPLGYIEAPSSAPAFYAANKMIYWPASSHIVRKNITSGPKERTIDAGLEEPISVAIDWQAQLLFVTSSGKFSGIFATDLDGEYMTKVLGDVSHVVSVQADPPSGKLYYIWEPINSPLHKSQVASGKMSPYMIERVNMDGSGRKALLASGTRITSLSLHEATSLYYVDVKMGKIKRLDLQTSKVTEVLATFVERPTSVVAHKMSLYYGDGLAVYRCDIRNCNNSVLFKNTTEPTTALTFYASELQPQFESACDKRKVKCQHLCLPIDAAESVCRCAVGYESVDKDGILCKAIDDILIYSFGDTIRGLKTEGSQNVSVLGPVSRVHSVGALAYHAESDSLFWTDKSSGAITRVGRDGSGRKEIIPAMETPNTPRGKINGLALDWMAGNIYWTDPKRNVIEVARLDGSSRYVVIANEEDLPEDLFVDASGRFLFYTSGLRIKRAWLDGSNVTILHTCVDSASDSSVGTAIAPITDLAVDTERGRVYWSRRGRIMSVTYAGTDPKVHLDKPNATIATLDLYGGVIYWGEVSAGRASIHAAPIANMSRSRILLDKFAKSIDDIQVYSSSRQRGTNDCSRAKDKCQELCLMNGSGARCVCAHGTSNGPACEPYNMFLMYSRVTKIESLHLFDDKAINAPHAPIEDKDLLQNAIALTYDYDRSLLMYSDLQSASINAVHFNGSGHTRLIEQQGAVEGLHYDTISDTLFWTCNSEPSVRKAAMDRQTSRSDVQIVVRLKRTDKPRGIDVDPCEARVYWTNWNQANPSIDRAFTNGYGQQAIITTRIMMPNSLTLDHNGKKLYWTDARLDKIERCEFDGSLRMVVTNQMSTHPFDIAVFGEFIFWTDWIEHGVVRANKHTGQEVVQVRSNTTRPMGIVAVSPFNNTCGLDACAVLNGQCAHECRVDSDGEARCHCRPPYALKSDGRSCALDVSNCASGQFACAEGPCIPFELTCDGVPHCSDYGNASDEDVVYCLNRSCPPGWFQCRSGARCIPQALVCDGKTHCADGTDEIHCPCPADHFTCNDGTCIPSTANCDGVADCAHYEDELECPRVDCRVKQMTNCRTTSDCFYPHNMCDGKIDCIDGSDEENCTATSLNRVSKCGEGTFACDGGACAMDEWRCDGRDDCMDGDPSSDEANCDTVKGPSGCLVDEVRCGNMSTVQCIEPSMMCDGYKDCSNGWDESQHCETNKTFCQTWEFTCLGSGICISAESICDGKIHCPDGSDEAACSCPDPTSFRCAASSDCLDKLQYCDGQTDCPDGSDEPPHCWPAIPGPISTTSAPVTHYNPECVVTCDNEACIPSELMCDGRDHCVDGKQPSRDEDPALCASLKSGCNLDEWLCANGACIFMTERCDGVNQCGDYSDEQHCNIDECVNDVCDQLCVDMVIGYACHCRPGYRANGRRCVDVDECKEDQPCDHICRNTLGSYACSCHDGHSLAADGFTCLPNSPVQATLLFTNRNYVRRVGLTPDSPTSILVHNLTNAVALDYDWRGNCFYWSDVTLHGSSIKRFCGKYGVGHNNTHQVLHSSTLRNPDGLAVDWVASNLYWCDKGTDTIEVSKLDGRYRKVIIKGGLQDPRAVALHPSEGTLYWTDWGENPHIGRAGMDGTKREVIISERLGWPNALTISYDTNELYFGDAREDYIAVANLDGSNIRKIFSRRNQPDVHLHHIFAVAVWSGYVYWSDWETRSIEACRRYRNLPGNTVHPDKMKECHIVTPTIEKPMDLRIYHPYRQKPIPELTEACAALNCSGLCLITPDSTKRVTCACPEHFILADDQRSCIANCTSAHYLCKETLKCIPYWWRCDTQDDCGDGSDEQPSCPKFHCSPGELQCDTNRCLHPTNICNGQKECDDGSDEIDCDLFTCLSNQFKCPSNATAGVTARCVAGERRCDGKVECAGGEDEMDCPPVTCSSLEFKCPNEKCIPLHWICDGDDDCGDNSDEKLQCSQRTCSYSEFRCSSGRCIPQPWVCDKEDDCQHGEDERDCDNKPLPTCEPSYFRCNDSQKCIPDRWMCDRQNDCDNGSDEEGCNYLDCTEAEFRCNDGQCVIGSAKCDGTRQCADGSDEMDCGPTCANGTFACSDPPGCIFKEWICDGDVDCDDGSDEVGCEKSKPMSCRAPMRACGPDSCVLPAHACDGRSDCPAGADEKSEFCHHYACPPSMYRCQVTNRCIPSHLRCDNVDDCGDGSDENPQYCKAVELCLGGNFNCENGLCINGSLRCNGNNDCGDGSDEANCARTPCEVHVCSQICVPKAVKHKDGENSYSCRCGAGYKLINSGEMGICATQDDKAELLISTDNGFKGASFYKPGLQNYEVMYRNDTVAKIDGHAIYWLKDQPVVYWVEYEAQVIRRFNLTLRESDEKRLHMGEVETLLRNAGSVRSIAVDYVAGRIYWTVLAPYPAIRAATLDARMQRTVISQKMYSPEDIVLHLHTRRVIWSDWGVSPSIEIAGMDGSDRRVLVKKRVWRPSGLAIDHHAARLYWTDPRIGSIQLINLDGSGRRVLVDIHDTKLPTAPLRLDVFEEFLVGVWRRGYVQIDKRRGTVRTVVPSEHKITNVRVVHPALQDMTLANPCDIDACHPSAICLLSPSAENRSCLCPDGLVATNGITEVDRSCRISPASLPCPRGCGPGTCLSGKCVCPPTHSGAHCQHNHCTDHCRHKGTCVFVDQKPQCICPHGWTGDRCEIPVIGCSDVICHNGGTCKSGGVCVCASGYRGDKCEICTGGDGHGGDLDCGDRGVCSRGVSGPTCRCGPGRVPPRCACAVECLNEGRCVVSRNGTVSCECSDGWTGTHCEKPRCDGGICPEPEMTFNCDGKECQNGGECVVTTGGAVCRCKEQWGGRNCTAYVGWDGPCKHLQCRKNTFCVTDDKSRSYCAIILNSSQKCIGARCKEPSQIGSDVDQDHANVWSSVAAVVGVLVLLLLVGSVAFIFIKRRSGKSFSHARLTENVEINNPMYLQGGDDDLEQLERSDDIVMEGDGSHFANPVYESMYNGDGSAHNTPTQRHQNEERANLLADACEDLSATPPPNAERSLLL